MPDDLLELAGELLELGGLLPGGGKGRKKAPAAGRPQGPAQEKITARRDKRAGEEPWEWKEEKPPWEY